jgi:UDP:flavonoid glycosyltransferase YjiC (YdhE family)
MPPLHTSELPWNNAGAADVQPISFEGFSRTDRLSAAAEMVVCNTFHEAEAGAFELLSPNVLPIGPLSSDSKPVGQFLPEDTRCLRWLDAQTDGSVVYVAFGSTTVLEPCQFQKLALGLELTGRPFLWVVRPDLTTGGEPSKAWFDEFRAGVADAGKGMVVSWCPQQQVLAHRAVACFVSHCAWNSTMEGVRNGLPFLCWPYFSDQ